MKESGQFSKLISGKKLKYYYVLQNILLTFVSNKLNGTLFEKSMPTLQPFCGALYGHK